MMSQIIFLCMVLGIANSQFANSGRYAPLAGRRGLYDGGYGYGNRGYGNRGYTGNDYLGGRRGNYLLGNRGYLAGNRGYYGAGEGLVAPGGVLVAPKPVITPVEGPKIVVGPKPAPQLRPLSGLTYRADDYDVPTPHEFSYATTDEDGNQQSREERGDGFGNVEGSYTLTDITGLSRVVNYRANAEEGFKADIVTNEPGTANENPADVTIQSNAPQIAPAGPAGRPLAYAPPAHTYADPGLRPLSYGPGLGSYRGIGQRNQYQLNRPYNNYNNNNAYGRLGHRNNRYY